MTSPISSRSVRLLTLLLLSQGGVVAAQQRLPGYGPAASERQRSLEQRLIAVPDTAVIRRHARTLAAEPHVAGTPAQLRTAEYVLQQMASWGLDTSRAEYRIYMPYHDSTVVDVLAEGRRQRLSLDEPPLPSDPSTGSSWPAMVGYSGAGDVTAPVVYVNYGLPADYRTLDSMGVDVRGKVAIARYGRSFRGIKAREAEKHGALALILYSDPLDDGFLVGEVYPDGPMRNPDGVQRGSILNSFGDPSTPGWPSTRDARRLAENEMDLAKIPVVPIGYANAERIMGKMSGPSIPDSWQGGLGFRYRIGSDAVSARVAVWPERGERAYKDIANTFGTLRGAVLPDELVIIGGHRDAWSPGAVDDVSGVIAVMEAARALGALAREGIRPDRTVIFATWDAEEWGLIGSTEWVEENAAMLAEQGVAYINLDVGASGRSFSAAGTATMHQLMRQLTGLVQQPGDTVTVLRDWSRRTVTSQRPQPPLGDLGGGSDFMGFYNHLGIPAAGFGFGGPGGSYHSGYDTWTFMERFADPGYVAHQAAGRIAALMVSRLANAPVVPFEPAELGRYLVQLVERTRREPGADRIRNELDRVATSASIMATVGDEFVTARAQALDTDPSAASLAEVNRLLREVERQFVVDGGLVDRPFLRNIIFASDRDNGYANVQFPMVVEALRDDDVARAAAAATELSSRIARATGKVESARRALRP